MEKELKSKPKPTKEKPIPKQKPIIEEQPKEEIKPYVPYWRY